MKLPSLYGHADGDVKKCQVQRYYALTLQDYVAPRLDSVAPMALTHGDNVREEVNGCMMMHRSA